MSNSNSITQDRLKELLNYDPITGIFTRNKRTAQRVRAGDIAGNKSSEGYLVVQLDYKIYKCHRLAWLYVYGEFPESQIDHINGIRTDNRIDNLRVATNAQNQQNLLARKNSSSGLIGIWYEDRIKKWRSKISANGTRIYLGSFDSPEEAHKAYLEAKKKYHEFQPELRNTKPA